MQIGHKDIEQDKDPNRRHIRHHGPARGMGVKKVAPKPNRRQNGHKRPPQRQRRRANPAPHEKGRDQKGGIADGIHRLGPIGGIGPLAIAVEGLGPIHGIRLCWPGLM